MVGTIFAPQRAIDQIPGPWVIPLMPKGSVGRFLDTRLRHRGMNHSTEAKRSRTFGIRLQSLTTLILRCSLAQLGITLFNS